MNLDTLQKYGQGLTRPTWARARSVINAPLRSPLARAVVAPLVSPRALDDYLELVDPCWSLEQVRARVVGVERETADVTSLLLQPNDNWRPHRAGQHVLLSVEIDGVRHTRTFTLSSAPSRPGWDVPLRITIKAHPAGRVSVWARDQARLGDVLTLSAPQGDFVLPTTIPRRLLFVSGGSGITPLVAMAQQLVRQEYDGDLVWIHSERDEIPLERDMRDLTCALKGGSLHVHRSLAEEGKPERYLSGEQITGWVPDWAQREVFVCGPLGLMELVESLYGASELSGQVHSEDFKPRWQSRPAPPRLVGAPSLLTFGRSGRQAEARSDVSLLEQAESAGLSPQHGCRRGICHECKCKKVSGVVRNELTGRTSDAPDEEIQLCISTPVGDVRIDL